MISMVGGIQEGPQWFLSPSVHALGKVHFHIVLGTAVWPLTCHVIYNIVTIPLLGLGHKRLQLPSWIFSLSLSLFLFPLFLSPFLSLSHLTCCEKPIWCGTTSSEQGNTEPRNWGPPAATRVCWALSWL